MVQILGNVQSSALQEVRFSNIALLQLHGQIQSDVLKRTIIRGIQDIQFNVSSTFEQEKIYFSNVRIKYLPASSIKNNRVLKHAIFENCTFDFIESHGFQLALRNNSMILFQECKFLHIDLDGIVMSATNVAFKRSVFHNLQFIAIRVEAVQFIMDESTIKLMAQEGLGISAEKISITNNVFNEIQPDAFKRIELPTKLGRNYSNFILLVKGNSFNVTKLSLLMIDLQSLDMLMKTRNTDVLKLDNNELNCDCTVQVNNSHTTDAEVFFYQTFEQSSYCIGTSNMHVRDYLENKCVKLSEEYTQLSNGSARKQTTAILNLLIGVILVYHH